LYGKSLRERANALIDIAHPKFREELRFNAKKDGIL
jgi:acyl-CoA hydrolase